MGGGQGGSRWGDRGGMVGVREETGEEQRKWRGCKEKRGGVWEKWGGVGEWACGGWKKSGDGRRCG